MKLLVFHFNGTSNFFILYQYITFNSDIFLKSKDIIVVIL